MKLRRCAVLAIFLLAAFPRSLAQGKPSSVTSGSRIAVLFNSECAGCHGENGRGVQNTPGLPDLRDPGLQKSRTDQEFADSVTNGKGLMPTFKLVLNGGQVRELVAYIRKLPSLPPQRRQGRTNCASCHGTIAPGSFIKPEKPPESSGPNK